jgi:hypothetical protein
MKWLNIIGLTFQFLAFWFAAPELLGESTLLRFQSSLKKFISVLPLLIILFVVLGYGLTFSILGVLKGIEASETGIEESSMYRYFLVMGVCTLLYFLFLAFYKKIKTALETKLAAPLVNRLIENSQARSSALVIGAVLFSLGFVLQLVVLILA